MVNADGEQWEDGQVVAGVAYKCCEEVRVSKVRVRAGLACCVRSLRDLLMMLTSLNDSAYCMRLLYQGNCYSGCVWALWGLFCQAVSPIPRILHPM